MPDPVKIDLFEHTLKSGEDLDNNSIPSFTKDKRSYWDENKKHFETRYGEEKAYEEFNNFYEELALKQQEIRKSARQIEHLNDFKVNYSIGEPIGIKDEHLDQQIADMETVQVYPTVDGSVLMHGRDWGLNKWSDMTHTAEQYKLSSGLYKDINGQIKEIGDIEWDQDFAYGEGNTGDHARVAPYIYQVTKETYDPKKHGRRMSTWEKLGWGVPELESDSGYIIGGIATGMYDAAITLIDLPVLLYELGAAGLNSAGLVSDETLKNINWNRGYLTGLKSTTSYEASQSFWNLESLSKMAGDVTVQLLGGVGVAKLAGKFSSAALFKLSKLKGATHTQKLENLYSTAAEQIVKTKGAKAFASMNDVARNKVLTEEASRLLYNSIQNGKTVQTIARRANYLTQSSMAAGSIYDDMRNKGYTPGEALAGFTAALAGYAMVNKTLGAWVEDYFILNDGAAEEAANIMAKSISKAVGAADNFTTKEATEQATKSVWGRITNNKAAKITSDTFSGLANLVAKPMNRFKEAAKTGSAQKFTGTMLGATSETIEETAEGVVEMSVEKMMHMIVEAKREILSQDMKTMPTYKELSWEEIFKDRLLTSAIGGAFGGAIAKTFLTAPTVRDAESGHSIARMVAEGRESELVEKLKAQYEHKNPLKRLGDSDLSIISSTEVDPKAAIDRFLEMTEDGAGSMSQNDFIYKLSLQQINYTKSVLSALSAKGDLQKTAEELKELYAGIDQDFYNDLESAFKEIADVDSKGGENTPSVLERIKSSGVDIRNLTTFDLTNNGENLTEEQADLLDKMSATAKISKEDLFKTLNASKKLSALLNGEVTEKYVIKKLLKDTIFDSESNNPEAQEYKAIFGDNLYEKLLKASEKGLEEIKAKEIAYKESLSKNNASVIEILDNPELEDNAKILRLNTELEKLLTEQAQEHSDLGSQLLLSDDVINRIDALLKNPDLLDIKTSYTTAVQTDEFLDYEVQRFINTIKNTESYTGKEFQEKGVHSINDFLYVYKVTPTRLDDAAAVEAFKTLLKDTYNNNLITRFDYDTNGFDTNVLKGIALVDFDVLATDDRVENGRLDITEDDNLKLPIPSLVDAYNKLSNVLSVKSGHINEESIDVRIKTGGLNFLKKFYSDDTLSSNTLLGKSVLDYLKAVESTEQFRNTNEIKILQMAIKLQKEFTKLAYGTANFLATRSRSVNLDPNATDKHTADKIQNNAEREILINPLISRNIINYRIYNKQIQNHFNEIKNNPVGKEAKKVGLFRKSKLNDLTYGIDTLYKSKYLASDDDDKPFHTFISGLLSDSTDLNYAFVQAIAHTKPEDLKAVNKYGINTAEQLLNAYLYDSENYYLSLFSSETTLDIKDKNTATNLKAAVRMNAERLAATTQAMKNIFSRTGTNVIKFSQFQELLRNQIIGKKIYRNKQSLLDLQYQDGTNGINALISTIKNPDEKAQKIVADYLLREASLEELEALSEYIMEKATHNATESATEMSQKESIASNLILQKEVAKELAIYLGGDLNNIITEFSDAYSTVAYVSDNDDAKEKLANDVAVLTKFYDAIAALKLTPAVKKEILSKQYLNTRFNGTYSWRDSLTTGTNNLVLEKTNIGIQRFSNQLVAVLYANNYNDYIKLYEDAILSGENLPDPDQEMTAIQTVIWYNTDLGKDFVEMANSDSLKNTLYKATFLGGALGTGKTTMLAGSVVKMLQMQDPSSNFITASNTADRTEKLTDSIFKKDRTNVSSINSIEALIKHLDNLPKDAKQTIIFDEATFLSYSLTNDQSLPKEERQANLLQAILENKPGLKLIMLGDAKQGGHSYNNDVAHPGSLEAKQRMYWSPAYLTRNHRATNNLLTSAVEILQDIERKNNIVSSDNIVLTNKEIGLFSSGKKDIDGVEIEYGCEVFSTAEGIEKRFEKFVNDRADNLDSFFFITDFKLEELPESIKNIVVEKQIKLRTHAEVQGDEAKPDVFILLNKSSFSNPGVEHSIATRQARIIGTSVGRAQNLAVLAIDPEIGHIKFESQIGQNVILLKPPAQTDSAKAFRYNIRDLRSTTSAENSAESVITTPVTPSSTTEPESFEEKDQVLRMLEDQYSNLSDIFDDLDDTHELKNNKPKNVNQFAADILLKSNDYTFKLEALINKYLTEEYLKDINTFTKKYNALISKVQINSKDITKRRTQALQYQLEYLIDEMPSKDKAKFNKAKQDAMNPTTTAPVTPADTEDAGPLAVILELTEATELDEDTVNLFIKTSLEGEFESINNLYDDPISSNELIKSFAEYLNLTTQLQEAIESMTGLSLLTPEVLNNEALSNLVKLANKYVYENQFDSLLIENDDLADIEDIIIDKVDYNNIINNLEPGDINTQDIISTLNNWALEENLNDIVKSREEILLYLREKNISESQLENMGLLNNKTVTIISNNKIITDEVVINSAFDEAIGYLNQPINENILPQVVGLITLADSVEELIDVLVNQAQVPENAIPKNIKEMNLDSVKAYFEQNLNCK